MYLLSIAAAEPQGLLKSSHVLELEASSGQTPSEMEQYIASAVPERRTVLPLEYISSSLNKNPREAIEIASDTPSSLAAQAARSAIEEAGIDAKEIGLVLGGSATPLQTIPSEAQRVAGALSLKTNAYDINGSSGELSLLLSNLLKWKDERLPDYILCVSTNTPTARLDYSKGLERYLFGDGAVALLLSPRIKGPIRVGSADYKTSAGRSSKTRVEIYGHIHIDDAEYFSYLSEQQQEIVRTLLSSNTGESDKFFFIDNHYPNLDKEALYSLGVHRDRHISHFDKIGSVLGTAPFITFSKSKAQIPAGSTVLLSVAGLGAGTGYVTLGVE